MSDTTLCKLCKDPIPEYQDGELQAHKPCLGHMINYQTREAQLRGCFVDNHRPAFELWLEDRQIIPILDMRFNFRGQPMASTLSLELALVNTDIEIVDGKVRIIMRVPQL